MNPDKCKLLITKCDRDISIILNNEIIECSESVKLLGVTIDNKLNFTEHITKLCKKVSSKLHALARVSNYMCQDKLRTLMKSFIESQFSYCPLIWMFHSRTLNNRINRLHERGLRLVYKDYTLTFDELLRKDKSFSIHHRNLQLLAIEMYKVFKGVAPAFMSDIFGIHPNANTVNVSANTRSGRCFYNQSNPKTVKYGLETLRSLGPKIWNLIPTDLKDISSLPLFKVKIRKWVPRNCPCRLCYSFVPQLVFL